MLHVCREYGISDVGLAKICKAHRIPRPPRGYWEKKRYGQRVQRIRLRSCDDPTLETIVFHLKIKPATESPSYDADILASIARARSLPKIVTAEQLFDAHPLVQQLQAQMVGNLTRGPHFRTVNLQPDHRARGLRILDALFKGIEAIAGKIVVDPFRWPGEMRVQICGQTVSELRLRHRFRRQDHSTKDRSNRSPMRNPICEYVPVGKLILCSTRACYPQVAIRDTENGQQIEMKLNRLLIRWAKYAGDDRIKQKERQVHLEQMAEQSRRQAEIEAEAQRERNRAQARQVAEQAKVAKLVNDATAWQQGASIRAYVQAVEKMLVARDGEIHPAGQAAAWLVWARIQADEMDPLKAPSDLPSNRPDRAETQDD
jgi:hypothetical protein